MQLSIIIPVYNAEAYLDSCLESIVECKEEFELILVNDGSTDSSSEICQKYANKDLRVKYYEKENKGVSDTRNFGLERATGEFICFVDADDYLSKDWYEKIYDAIKLDADVLIFSDSVTGNYGKEKIFDNLFGKESEIAFLGTPWSKIFKSELIKKNNMYFDTNLIHGEDLLFNYELFLKADKIEFISDSFYCYRVNGDSATHSFNSRFIDSDKLFHEKYMNIYFANNCKGENYSDFNIHKAIKLIIYKVSLTKNLKNSCMLKCFQTQPYIGYINEHKTLLNFLIKLRFYKLLLFIYIMKNKITKVQDSYIVRV